MVVPSRARSILTPSLRRHGVKLWLRLRGREVRDEVEGEDPHKDLLQALLGFQYEELFNEDGELKDFRVQNNTIILNDQVIPISNLYDIIEKLNSGEIQIIDIEIE